MQITFKSGAQIEMDVDEFTYHRNKFDGRLVQLDWTTPPSAGSKLNFIQLGDVAAVVTLRRRYRRWAR